MPFVSVPDAIQEIRAGRIVVVVDDEDRENEGDLTIAAEKVTPEIVNFMAVQGRGLICLALTAERCDYLRLPLMSPTNTSMFGTAFCESIDARAGVTTGISAADRTRTILQTVDPACLAADLARPGHMFPLRAREGGVLVRAGQTIRIRKLCKEINEQGQLDQEQRIVVVMQALEFCKTGGKEVSSLELGFISTLAEGLNITPEEYKFIESFVLNSFTNVPATPDLLIINGIKKFDHKEAKHAYNDLLKGHIWILFVPSVNKYFVRFIGSGELSMNGQLLQEDKAYPFSQGSSIKGYKITPIYYWDVTMQFLKEEFKASRVVYEVNNLEFRFKSGTVGIHHMSFKEESGR